MWSCMYVSVSSLLGGFSLSLSRGMLVYHRIRLARQRDDEEAASTRLDSTRLDSTRLDSTRAAASRENRPFSSTPVAVVVVVVWFLCDVITYRGIYVRTCMCSMWCVERAAIYIRSRFGARYLVCSWLVLTINSS